MQIFLICSVRNASKEESAAQIAYVKKLEAAGHRVHLPPENTNQDDPIGPNICETNRMAMFRADEVHVWYSPNSVESIFDLGMLFMLIGLRPKRVVVANSDKSLENVLLALVARAQKQPRF